MTSNKKRMTGLVVSDKMDKTIVVEVTNRTLHPIYKKCVVESRHISKDKCWRLEEIVARAR